MLLGTGFWSGKGDGDTLYERGNDGGFFYCRDNSPGLIMMVGLRGCIVDFLSISTIHIDHSLILLVEDANASPTLRVRMHTVICLCVLAGRSVFYCFKIGGSKGFGMKGGRMISYPLSMYGNTGHEANRFSQQPKGRAVRHVVVH